MAMETPQKARWKPRLTVGRLQALVALFALIAMSPKNYLFIAFEIVIFSLAFLLPRE
jgi:hypothetical protein